MLEHLKTIYDNLNWVTTCYEPTCISLRRMKWQNIDRISVQGNSERMSHVTAAHDFGIQMCKNEDWLVVCHIPTIYHSSTRSSTRGNREGIKGCSIIYLDQFFMIIFVNKILVTFLVLYSSALNQELSICTQFIFVFLIHLPTSAQLWHKSASRGSNTQTSRKIS